MAKIYVTGDIHGSLSISRLERFQRRNPGLNKNDYMIVCGDFGMYFDGAHGDYCMKKAIESLPFNILWVDGNHENFDIIDKLPVCDFMGGKAQKCTNNCYRLMRGEIYTILGKKFFCFGGGLSIDKAYRAEGKTWWRKELPSDEEYAHGLSNLEESNYKVDYIVTHASPLDVLMYFCPTTYDTLGLEERPLNNFLTHVSKIVEYKKWFIGHLHFNDKETFPKKVLLYEDIELVLDTNK